MDGEKNFDAKDETQLECAWTIDEIRKSSANWTLAGDVGLFNLLNEFSHDIISRTHEVENAVDSLVHQTKMASVKVNNIINDFHMLSNLQFVENRVYDEGVQELVPEEKQIVEKTKEQKETEMLPKILKAIDLGLAVLDIAFDKINVNEISDSDDEDLSSEGRTILEPKDPYEQRPLPFIIGSQEFRNCDYAGLKDLVAEEIESSIEEESSLSESDETSSDEGEPLPRDENKFSVVQNQKIPAQSISDGLSSSDGSELFGSEKEENGYASDSSFESKRKESKNIQRSDIEVTLKEKESRQNSISSFQAKLNLPQVLPVPKAQEIKDDNLFTNDELSDDESPFRKKDGLFASDVRFGDTKSDMFDGDLFGESTKENKETPRTEIPKAPQEAVKTKSAVKEKTKGLDLFGNDEDSEDDIFNSLIRTKKPSSKESHTGSQDSSEKAESLSTPSSAPSMKASGNAFDFVTGGGNADLLFGDESDADDLFSSKKKTKKFDFDAVEDDGDLFGITTPLNSNSKQPEPSKKEAKPLTSTVSKKAKDSLFEDSENSDQDNLISNKPMQSSTAIKSKTEKSLFDDDDEDDDDIFSQISKKQVTPKLPKPASKKPVAIEEKPISYIEKNFVPDEKKPIESIFETSDKDEVKAVEPLMQSKTKEHELFNDVVEQSEEFPSAAIPKVQAKKPTSLFDDSDNIDLFQPKSTETIRPKQKSLSPVSKVLDAEQSGIDFDVPIDSSKTLTALSKDRVKVAAKRRLPSRKNRIAALDSADLENKTEPNNPKMISENNTQDKDLFTDQPKKTPFDSSYKAQEKKKMNLMSQLINEVNASKVGKKNVFQDDIDDDNDVDIFAEVANKSEPKRQSFSFLPPKENSIDSGFPSETKDETKEEINVSDLDNGENDDFFAEPSFKTFRSSISHADSVLATLDDDEDDDDLFSTNKSNILPKPKVDATVKDDLFDESDIFADIQKEKYEMFPSQLYDEDDDIFGSIDQPSSDKSGNFTNKNNTTVKKVEKQQVNAFDDPLTGLLEDD